ncbi:NAD(P)H-binding protein [Streptomyces sp. XM4011]|uniref:NAD(P)H-binding protein n=1 Tax=Streptomyces sp. XM4011 TaxID=2929780 RepID=UPI001FFA5CCB|nr:NAD(P)H-binding protein [Streptomyces sp. XM4011]MCK1813988.1 NAD(P)H-binding protein [Streptomyces sp. XM4011]
MRTVIAGGHGKIAQRLERLLAARGDRPAGLIRKSEQAEALLAAGAEPLVCDLESASVAELTRHLEGADAVVFAAGAGPGSGAERKETVDRAAAALLADAAEAAGVLRYVMVSAINVDEEPPAGTDPVFAAYLRAKAAADADLRARTSLDWTILRPGRLTDAPGTGLVDLSPDAPRGEITRDDVAAVLAALLDTPATTGLTLNLVNGATAIPAAVARLTAG